MATRQEGTRSTKQGKATTRSAKAVSPERYPKWKVELFRTGIAERRSSAASQISGRAMRAPGA